MQTSRPLSLLSFLSLCLDAPGLGGCYGLPDAAGEATQALTGGAPATVWQRQRAAVLVGLGSSPAVCTATIISQRHLLTAAHCRAAWGGNRAYLYTASTTANLSSPIAISNFTMPAGVAPGSNDYTDDAGRYADIAVIRLGSPIPSTSEVAQLSWLYHGASDPGPRVGAGAHGGLANGLFALATNDDVTYDPSDASGSFRTATMETNAGDDGGPFYRGVNGRLLGVLSFPQTTPLLPRKDRYTSVARHLHFILTTIGYTGAYTLTNSGGVPPNAFLSGATETNLECRYACDVTPGCAAFSWVSPGTCYLRPSPSGGSGAPVSGTVSGVRR